MVDCAARFDVGHKALDQERVAQAEFENPLVHCVFDAFSGKPPRDVAAAESTNDDFGAVQRPEPVKNLPNASGLTVE